MASPISSRGGGEARTGLTGATVAAVAFFDGVFIGAPVALLAASVGSLLVYAVAQRPSPCWSWPGAAGSIAYAVPYVAM